MKIKQTGIIALILIFTSIQIIAQSSVEDFVIDDNFYITKDVFLSETMSGLLEKQSIELKEGKYNVIFDEISGYYYSLVDSSMN